MKQNKIWNVELANISILKGCEMRECQINNVKN